MSGSPGWLSTCWCCSSSRRSSPRCSTASPSSRMRAWRAASKRCCAAAASARAGPLQAPPRLEARRAALRAVARPAVGTRPAHRRGLVLRRARRGEPRHRGRAAAVRAGAAGVHLLPAADLEPLFAPARVRGRRLCGGPLERGRAGEGAGQALPGQRRYPHARSAALGLLRFASAGGDPHRAPQNHMTKLSKKQAKDMLRRLKGWSIEDGKLAKLYPFSNYYQTMAFVNALAWISHREDHHPDLTVGYNKCRVEYSTHAVGGLSENDFICAAKCDALFEL